MPMNGSDKSGDSDGDGGGGVSNLKIGLNCSNPNLAKWLLVTNSKMNLRGEPRRVS